MEKFNEDDFENEMKERASHDDFKVPANYFEKLPIQISEKIRTKKTRFNIAWLSRVALVTCICIISIIRYKALNKNEIKSIKAESVAISDLLTESDEMSEEALLDAYAVNTSSENTDIADYLIENNIEETDIINNLN